MSSPDGDKGLTDGKVETSTDEEKGMSDKEETKIVTGEPLPEKEEAPKSKQEAKSSSSSLKYLILGAILVCAIVVAITVPLVMRDDDDDDDTKSAPFKNDTDQGGFANITTFSVFNPEVPNFDTDILAGYRSEEEFAKGVTLGLQSLLDRAVGRNLGVHGYANLALGGGTRGGGMFANAPTVDGDMAESESASATGVDDTVEDYGTNNQESGVEEGDVVVSNGSHLFTAYGDRVVRLSPQSEKEMSGSCSQSLLMGSIFLTFLPCLDRSFGTLLLATK